MNNNKINKITGTGILIAVVIVLQLIANYVSIGPVNITLSLVPMALGAIIFGPTSGLILGLVNGIIVILAPATQALFFADYPFQTIVVCLLKTGLAGLAAGFIYRLLKNKNFVLSIILASLSIPLINTGLFACAMLTIFRPLLEKLANGESIVGYLFLTFIGFNFLIEFAVNSALTPAIITLTKLRSKINN